ncbi:MAG: hypothetical protein ABIH48_00155 [Candidatus Falkowbacteria bacterium]
MITYGQLYEQIGVDPKMVKERNRGANILALVNKQTIKDHDFMISAIVVLQYKEIPEKGFFEFAEELGRLPADSTTEERMNFFQKEKKKIFDFYKVENKN